MAYALGVLFLLTVLGATSVVCQVSPGVQDCPHCQNNCNGDRSVAYVIDNTGSMRNDIGQVCERTREMAIIAEQHQLHDSIHRCLLVPFGDPVIGPPQFFNHLNQLADAACSLRPTGGVDCPEKVLSGLLMGLESSCPKSTVYVFTDAVAKDLELLGRVLEVIQSKQIKVVFVLSGSCESSDSSYYDTITAISGGQLFRIGKDNVGDILKFSQLSINNEPQVLLLWEQTTPPFWSSDFVVEPAMTSVQVVVSCDNESPTVELYQPGFLDPIKPRQQSMFVDWKTYSSSVLAVLDTQSLLSFGTWQLHVTSLSTCRVSVTAHGVEEMTSSFAKITEINEFGEEVSLVSPEQGSNYIVVSTPDSHIVQYVELVGMDGNRFSSSSPTDGGMSEGAAGAKDTVIGPTTVPGESFFIRYRGLQNISDNGGHTGGQPFKRYSPTALTPKATAPLAGSSSSISADHCQHLKLKCSGLNGYDQGESEYPVTWFRNAHALVPGSLVANASIIQSGDISVLEISQFAPHHAGLYSCFVAKPTGLALVAEYDVIARENTSRPCAGEQAENKQPVARTPSIWTAQHAVIHCLMLQCIARADNPQPEQVQWANTQTGHRFTRSTVHRHFAVLSNGSLRICDPQQQHLGWYMCSTPHSTRPSAVRVKASDLNFQTGANEEEVDEEEEEVLDILQNERDEAKQAATEAKADVKKLQSTVLSLQRQLHNADAERLRTAGSNEVCHRRLTRIRTTLGLLNRNDDNISSTNDNS
ncbi:hemicentin-1-like [Sycon ciliatum]|uniref:hemicentin-1-like n=1 Tax=Sycon ciliatum TaxID=27933 RepID=UPI0031F6F708